jgi:two-component system, sensor histidine kinase RegB
MKFFKTSKYYSLNKPTYVNLRWIVYIGQIAAILTVQFFLKFKFDYIDCILIVFLGILSNLYLKFKIRENQLNNSISTAYLFFDIIQLGFLIYLTGGITNPFIVLIIVPSVLSAQYLNLLSTVALTMLTIIILFITSFLYYELPHPEIMHFHAPNYYLYSIPIAILISLIFLVYFSFQFGKETRIRKEAYDKMQEIMAQENELLSLGGQAAAAAHSLGTPLSTILLTAKELKKEFGHNIKFKTDLDLLISQSNRCSEILKKLSLNPIIEDEFLDTEVTFSNYIHEIVRSYQKISEKIFVINSEEFKNQVKSHKSLEIVYGLRNFIGNANKFSNKKVKIFLKSNKKETEIIIQDDGPGFPKDLIDKHRLGEPYIRSMDDIHISKYGLGLGTFIGKTLLEKNFAEINFKNLEKNSGAEVKIKWINKDLNNI